MELETSLSACRREATDLGAKCRSSEELFAGLRSDYTILNDKYSQLLEDHTKQYADIADL